MKSVVMRFTVKEPSTGVPLQLEARPERFNGEQGYRILSDYGSNFFITNRYGVWRVGDDHHIEPELLEIIGLAIEEQPEY
jgi:hypothetical protein